VTETTDTPVAFVDDDLERIFREAAEREGAAVRKRLGLGGEERRSTEPPMLDSAGRTRALRQLRLAQAFQADPLGLHGTCDQDGSELRLIMRWAEQLVYLCCTADPMHCLPYGN
jgi:hypothetical protein